MTQPGKKERTTLEVERVGDVAVVRIVSRLTEEELSDDLRTEAHAAAKSGEVNWVLDVSKVERIDGSGLGEILAALTILSEAGGSLAVPKPSQGFHRFFNSPDLITGPIRVFESIEEASEAIQNQVASFLPNMD